MILSSFCGLNGDMLKDYFVYLKNCYWEKQIGKVQLSTILNLIKGVSQFGE